MQACCKMMYYSWKYYLCSELITDTTHWSASLSGTMVAELKTEKSWCGTFLRARPAVVCISLSFTVSWTLGPSVSFSCHLHNLPPATVPLWDTAKALPAVPLQALRQAVVLQVICMFKKGVQENHRWDKVRLQAEILLEVHRHTVGGWMHADSMLQQPQCKTQNMCFITVLHFKCLICEGIKLEVHIVLNIDLILYLPSVFFSSDRQIHG